MVKALRTSVRTGGLRQGGLQAGLGSDSIFATSSLDLNFAVNKNLGALVDATTGSNLVTFIRASSGTYVGSDGLIKTATTNLLLQSEDFSTTWAKGANTTITPNYGAAPNGTMTADRVEMVAGSGTFLTQSVSVVSGVTYSFSVYARATSGTAKIALQQGGVNIQVWTISTTWQRLLVQFTATATGSTTLGFDNDDSATDYILWGAQLEQSTTVGEYVKTTGAINSAPRFDHDPTTGESLGLLVEESGTNLLQRTEEFDDAYWQKAAGSTVTPYAGASPDGLTTAETYTTTGAGQSIYNGTGVTVTAGTAYTFSVYVKLGTMSAANYMIAVYDLSNSAFIAVDIAPTIAPTASSWSRVTYTFTTPIANPTATPPTIDCTSVRVYPFRNGSLITSSTVHLWGAQLEADSFPTSYIKNVDTVLGTIRAADVASISGSNFSSWYRQDEGTVFTDSQTPYPVATGKFPTPLVITDGYTSDNNFAVGFLTEVLASSLVENNNTNATPNYMSPLSGVRRRKISIAVADNDAFAVTNGTLTSPKVNNILLPRNHAQAIIGGNLSYNSMNGTIRRLTYWPTRLPNDTLQTITQ
jgi:hypothetical protein